MTKRSEDLTTPLPSITIDELAARTETPVRTIRYYIQQGLVSRPQGEKRGAYYTEAHLHELIEIRRWIGAGMSLERIRDLLHPTTQTAQTTTAAPLPAPRTLHAFDLSHGITLQIDRKQASLTQRQIEGLLATLAEHLRTLDIDRHQEKD